MIQSKDVDEDKYDCQAHGGMQNADPRFQANKGCEK